MHVINSPFVFITESFVCHGKFLKFFASFGARIFVRMVFQRQFTIGFFQL